MTNLTNQQSRDRRATMSAEQRANLDRLALVTERFRLRNVRMTRGLEHGFKALEHERTSDARIALSEVK
ncbi:MAG: hypothetical protein WC565_06610 [Parcubacteria group bacterium]|jgi:hypothetical protein